MPAVPIMQKTAHALCQTRRKRHSCPHITGNTRVSRRGAHQQVGCVNANRFKRDA